MKNKREIHKALLEGKRLTAKPYSPKEYIYMDEEGNYQDQAGFLVSPDFSDFSKWQIWEEPKRTFSFTEKEFKEITDPDGCGHCVYEECGGYSCTDKICEKGIKKWFEEREVK